MNEEEFFDAIGRLCEEYAPAAQGKPDFVIIVKYQDPDGLHCEVFDNQDSLENTLCLLEDGEDFIAEAIEEGLEPDDNDIITKEVKPS